MFKKLLLALFSIHSYAVVAEELELWAGFELDSLRPAITEFESKTEHKIRVRTFNTENIRAELLLAENAKFYKPDLIWIPSDFIGLKDHIDLAPMSTYFPDKTSLELHALELVTNDGEQYGLPVVLGNHLVVYFNKSRTAKPSEKLKWESLLKQADETGKLPIAMMSPNMYFVAAFSSLFFNNAEDYVHDTDAWQELFSFYYMLTSQYSSSPNCDHKCARHAFLSGEVPYLIDGDWAYGELHQLLGEQLGITALPEYRGKSMQSLNGAKVLSVIQSSYEQPNKAQAIELFLTFVQSEKFRKQLASDYQFISPYRADNQAKLDNDRFAALYTEYLNSMPMPSNFEMAIFWEAIGRANRRHQSGMPLSETGPFISEFMKKHLRKVSEVE